MTARIDAAYFRTVLGHVPTAVAVLASGPPDAPTAILVGSFASISLEPPLVGAFIGRSSTSWPAIAQAGSFVANILAADQADLARQFSRRAGDKFVGVRWEPSARGHPLLPGCIAALECEIEQVQTIGDHLLVVAEVESLSAPGGRPLIFFKGELEQLDVASDVAAVGI
jgi:3-hydroxy-9,10-secoandrosta-1,3,5(10)-triene-9,17-dione monooxygenase reductase component